MEKDVFSKAENPEFDGKQYHIALAPGDIPECVLLPGDPARSKKIAKIWDTFEKVAEHREFVTYRGYYRNTPLAVTSTGIGPSSVEIAVTELANIGAKTFIRVGSCGSLRKEIKCGELVISLGAVRLEHTSSYYVPVEYPAISDYQVTAALIQAAKTLNLPYHIGITASSDSFYLGQGRPGFKNYKQIFTDTILPMLQRTNVLNFEMEASCLFTLASIYGLRAGCICAVYANRVTGEFEVKGEEEASKVASEAAILLQTTEKR
ncbi:MAG: nucleoside phosphorylase [Candidatus Heimdallarchaeota archaeon]